MSSAMPYVLQLPMPPSLHAYYQNARRTVRRGAKAGKSYLGKMISPEGMAFRGEVLRLSRAGHQTPPRLSGRLSIVVHVMPPKFKADGSENNNRRDLDNLWKCLLDALTKAEVILDDALFDDIRMTRGNAHGKGAVMLAINQFDPHAAAEAVRIAGILVATSIGTLDLFGEPA